MPQTLLALLALMLLTQFALRQQRNVIRSRLSEIEMEVTTIASAVAVERLDRIASMPFDDAAREGNILAGPSNLTPRTSFRADAPSDDVDDFDGAEIIVYKDSGIDTLTYRVNTEVFYVSDTDLQSASTTPTKLKRIVVAVESRDILVGGTVKLDRVVSCGSSCAW